MSNPKIVDSSPAMIQTKTIVTIPFNILPIGKSVCVPMKSIKETSLRTNVSTANTKKMPSEIPGYVKRFRCIKHENDGVYEIGRLNDVLAAEAHREPLPQWDSSPAMRE